MALIHCSECGKEISDKAKQCVHCGYPIDSYLNLDEKTEKLMNIQCENIAEPIQKTKVKKSHGRKNRKCILKIIIGLIALITILAIVCYKPILYRIGIQQFETGNYEKASDIFLNVGDYSDAQNYRIECHKHIYADTDFLDAIEKSIIKRQELIEENYDEKAIIKTELTYLEDFYTQKFYDAELQANAQLYITALNTQLSSLDSKFIASTKIWMKNQVQRYAVLNYLYDKYDLLANDTKFIATYVDETESIELELQALEKIEADINKQFDEIETINFSGNTASVPVKNNTAYKYNIFVQLTYYDKNDKFIGEDFGTVFDIAPNKKVTVKVPCPSNWDTCYIDWDVNGVS